MDLDCYEREKGMKINREVKQRDNVNVTSIVREVKERDEVSVEV